MTDETALPDAEGPERDAVSFSMRGFRDGFRKCVPVAIGVGGYGLVFGVLARDAGLSTGEATLMSATVLAGAAQLVAVDLWRADTTAVAIVVTTFVVNLRYVLMSATLHPWFRHLSRLQAYGSLFFTADENWALTVKRLRDGQAQGAFLLGSGLAIWLCWVGATVVGAALGERIGDPSTYGLDFVLTAVFVTLAVSLWEGRETALPWTVAGGVAVTGAAFLPGRWYILLGGLAASAVEVTRRE